MISEPLRLSMRDESAPIRAQSAVDRFRHLEVGMRKGETRDTYNRRRRKNSDLKGNPTDHAGLVSHNPNKRSDSISHPFGDPKDLINPMSGRLDESDLINNFLDEGINKQEKMTSQIKSILKNLENKIPRQRNIISESNTPEESDE
jgi:hypothetical protein